MERYVKTYSDFINEARTKQWLDDVPDKEGNLSNIRLDDTTRIRILEFIYDAGQEGRRYTDIVKFVVEQINGDIYHHTTHRGHISGQLTGIPGRHWSSTNAKAYGLLYRYCERNDKGRWVLTNDKLINHFMNDDFRGLLDDEARDALSELLYIDK